MPLALSKWLNGDTKSGEDKRLVLLASHLTRQGSPDWESHHIASQKAFLRPRSVQIHTYVGTNVCTTTSVSVCWDIGSKTCFLRML